MKPLTAVEILRAAVARSYDETVKTKEVRAALVALKPRVPREKLDWFWDSADTPNQIGRSQNVRAAFRGILHHLGLPDE